MATFLNSSTQKTETGGLWVQGQPWLYSKTLSQPTNNLPNVHVSVLLEKDFLDYVMKIFYFFHLLCMKF
jgi:hypothetical protein